MALTCGFVLACAGQPADEAAQPESTRAAQTPDDAADVLARVNGAPIRMHELRALVSARGIPARDALRLLEDARLLEQHAAALGFEGTRATRDEIKRASVAALLAREVSTSPTDVSLARQRYTALLDGLRARTVVIVHEDTVQAAFADDANFRASRPR